MSKHSKEQTPSNIHFLPANLSQTEKVRILKQCMKTGCIDFSENESLNGDFDELVDIRDRIERLTLQEEKLKGRIQQAMGDMTKATFQNGSITWKRCKDTIGLNTKALLEDFPNLVDEYPQIRIGVRRFIINT